MRVTFVPSLRFWYGSEQNLLKESECPLHSWYFPEKGNSCLDMPGKTPRLHLSPVPVAVYSAAKVEKGTLLIVFDSKEVFISIVDIFFSVCTPKIHFLFSNLPLMVNTSLNRTESNKDM